MWQKKYRCLQKTAFYISEYLAMVRDFYERIFSREDPFAQLRKVQDGKKELLTTEKRQISETRNSIIDDTYYSVSPQMEKKKSHIGFVALIAVLVLIIVAYVSYSRQRFNRTI